MTKNTIEGKPLQFGDPAQIKFLKRKQLEFEQMQKAIANGNSFWDAEVKKTYEAEFPCPVCGKPVQSDWESDFRLHRFSHDCGAEFYADEEEIYLDNPEILVSK